MISSSLPVRHDLRSKFSRHNVLVKIKRNKKEVYNVGKLEREKKQCVDTQIDRSREKNSEVVGHQRLTGKRRNYLNTHKKRLRRKCVASLMQFRLIITLAVGR